MVPGRSRLRSALETAPVLPVRTWFNRWFVSVSDHVTDVGGDTQQVVKQARDDLVHEVRASRVGLAGHLQPGLDRVADEVRAEAAGVAEVALATDRRLARLEAAVAFLVDEHDAAATAIVDVPWVHRALGGVAAVDRRPPRSRRPPRRRAAGRRARGRRGRRRRHRRSRVVRDVDADDARGASSRTPAGRWPAAAGSCSPRPGPSPTSCSTRWSVLDERYVALDRRRLAGARVAPPARPARSTSGWAPTANTPGPTHVGAGAASAWVGGHDRRARTPAPGARSTPASDGERTSPSGSDDVELDGAGGGEQPGGGAGVDRLQPPSRAPRGATTAGAPPASGPAPTAAGTARRRRRSTNAGSSATTTSAPQPSVRCSRGRAAATLPASSTVGHPAAGRRRSAARGAIDGR